MGLTIHYSLRFADPSPDEARRLIEQLRLRALDLPFQEVGDVIDLSGKDCDYEQHDTGPQNHWLLVQATHSFEHDDCFYSLAPQRVIAFSTSPGEGSEQANFGLCLYPRTAPVRSGKSVKQIKTKLPAGWCWQSFCKTQYASNPSAGDVENFLRCHLSIVRLLDRANKLGILHEVTDEGGYWESRDVKALAKTVGEWNAMMAGFVGGVKDLLAGHDLKSEITRFPNFEHLEAEGRAGDEAEEEED